MYEQVENSSKNLRGKIIPTNRINDNFCDCVETGIDETATNTCIMGKFYCPHKFELGKTIPTYQINDGHCDCCDCADEYKIELSPQRCLQSFQNVTNENIKEINSVKIY